MPTPSPSAPSGKPWIARTGDLAATRLRPPVRCRARPRRGTGGGTARSARGRARPARPGRSVRRPAGPRPLGAGGQIALQGVDDLADRGRRAAVAGVGHIGGADHRPGRLAQGVGKLGPGALGRSAGAAGAIAAAWSVRVHAARSCLRRRLRQWRREGLAARDRAQATAAVPGDELLKRRRAPLRGPPRVCTVYVVVRGRPGRRLSQRGPGREPPTPLVGGPRAPP